MTTSAFWDIIETARARARPGRPFDQALIDCLTSHGQQQIIEYQAQFDEAHDALYRTDVWAAAYLIGGGCSDDSFIDFRAGLIAQGRRWYERVKASPDNLADHPAVAVAPVPHFGEPLFYEEVNYAAPHAFEQITGIEGSFNDAWFAVVPQAPQHSHKTLTGAAFDFEDEGQMRHHLPRLSALYLISRQPPGHHQVRGAAGEWDL